MKTLAYEGPGKTTLTDKPRPALQASDDAVTRVTLIIICGTDLYIIKGDTPTCEPERTLSHEGVGVVESVGATVISLQRDDHVLISYTSSYGERANCRRGIYSHCETGGWVLGHHIDDTQAEYVRIPHVETGLYKLLSGVDEEMLVMLSSIFPIGFKCDVFNGHVRSGNSIMIIGTGPTGLTPLLTAQSCSSAQIIMVDTNATRLETVSRLGVTTCIDVFREGTTTIVKRLTDGVSVDCVIEVVGIPATFELCQQLVAPGGVITSIGVHGAKAGLHLETLRSQNITITTRLMNTISTPMLLKMVHTERLLPGQLVTHRFRLDDVLTAYDTFHNATRMQVLKVIIPTQAAAHIRWIFYFVR